MYASTYCFVIRPPAPVPRTCFRSMLYSRAILRTSGERGPGPSSAAGGGGGAGAGAPGGCGALMFSGDAAAAGCGAGACSSGDADAPPDETCAEIPTPDDSPASLIRPTTVLIPTVFPSSTRISDTIPAAGEGISVSTLSV